MFLKIFFICYEKGLALLFLCGCEKAELIWLRSPIVQKCAFRKILVRLKRTHNTGHMLAIEWLNEEQF